MPLRKAGPAVYNAHQRSPTRQFVYAPGKLAEEETLQQATQISGQTNTSWLGVHPFLQGIRRRWGIASAVCVTVVIVGLLLLIISYRSTGAKDPAVATLAQTAGAQWADKSYFPGASLQPGWLKLQAGAALVTFHNGGRVLLEGPAEFRVVSSGEGFCRVGRISAQVPTAARGFKIGTPGFTVTDLGTAFGLVVSETKPAEVHVFEGQVEIAFTESGTPARRLQAGEALRVKGSITQSIPAKPKSFLSEDKLNSGSREHSF